MKPGNHYLMLKPIETGEKVTASGVIYKLENQVDTSPTRKGMVLQIGERLNGKMLKGRRIQTGNIVNYFPDLATEIKYEKDTILLIHLSGISSVQ